MNTEVSFATDQQDLLFDEFKNLCILFRQKSLQHGVRFRDFSEDCRLKFRELSDLQKKELLEKLRSMLRVPHLENSFRVDSEKKSLLYVLQSLNLSCPVSDFTKYLQQDDIVEVFNDEGVQIYRSWSYYRFTSYTIEELMLYDWNTLYERPVFIINRLMSLMPKIFEPNCGLISYKVLGIEPYLVRHSKNILHPKTQLKMSFPFINFEMKYAMPLVDPSGVTKAFISTARAFFIENEAQSGAESSQSNIFLL